jgi:transposase
MEVLHPRCAGLDVHKDIVVACTRVLSEGKVTQQVRSFSTKTHGLMELAQWLEDAGCTHVAMEATGVYWKPVWHVLEEQFELLLANAQHVKNVPGRKSDVNDATWLADLLAHGLIRGSFVPPAPMQSVRNLTRTRKQFVRETTQHVLRIQKTLEDSNIKLASVISNVLGVTGRAILNALCQGQTDPDKLADLCLGRRFKASRLEIVQSLRGTVTDDNRLLLTLHLRAIDFLNGAIADVDARLKDLLAPSSPRSSC